MDKILFTLFIVFPLFLSAQQKRKIKLQEAIIMAQTESLSSQSVTYAFQSSQWQYKSFRKSYLPSFNLTGTLPSVNQNLDKITQPDGTDKFQRRSQATSNLQLNVDQKIGLTGGTISLISRLERIDLLSDPKSTNWLSSPLSVALTQPLLKFNPMKWELREQPLINNQSKQKYSEDKEEVARQVSSLFFALLSSQKVEEMARQNMNYNDTIFQLSQGRFQLGKIAENELLQIELAHLNSEIRLKQAQLKKDVDNLKLKNYLGIAGEIDLEAVFEDSVPHVNIDIKKAVDLALEHNSQLIALELQRLQGEKRIDQAKSNKRLNVDLYAQYGLSQQTNKSFSDVYQNPQDNQLFRVGFRMPITTWGANAANYKAALVNQNKQQADYEIAVLNFQAAAYEKIRSFSIQKDQIRIAKKANEVAEKRYFIAQQRYLIGKITTTDLNIATQERDRARTDYINTISNFWRNYYEIRKLTHYDFVNNQMIDGGE